MNSLQEPDFIFLQSDIVGACAFVFVCLWLSHIASVSVKFVCVCRCVSVFVCLWLSDIASVSVQCVSVYVCVCDCACLSKK